MDAKMEKELLTLLANENAKGLEKFERAHGSEAARVLVNAKLSAVAAWLVAKRGPQEAYATFQRIADECAAPIMEQRA